MAPEVHVKMFLVHPTAYCLCTEGSARPEQTLREELNPVDLRAYLPNEG